MGGMVKSTIWLWASVSRCENLLSQVFHRKRKYKVISVTGFGITGCILVEEESTINNLPWLIRCPLSFLGRLKPLRSHFQGPREIWEKSTIRELPKLYADSTESEDYWLSEKKQLSFVARVCCTTTPRGSTKELYFLSETSPGLSPVLWLYCVTVQLVLLERHDQALTVVLFKRAPSSQSCPFAVRSSAKSWLELTKDGGPFRPGWRPSVRWRSFAQCFGRRINYIAIQSSPWPWSTRSRHTVRVAISYTTASRNELLFRTSTFKASEWKLRRNRWWTFASDRDRSDLGQFICSTVFWRLDGL